MKQRFLRLSIATKLMVIMMTIGTVALLLMGAALLTQEALQLRKEMHGQLFTLAEVIGSRSTAALTFADALTAEENLRALQVKEDIVYAVITDEFGNIFAEYPSSVEADLPRPGRAPDTANRRHMTVVQTITLDGEPIGDIRITASMDVLYDNLARYLLFMGLVMAVCFAIALFISSRLHRLISSPILQLRRAMREVSERRDYSVRVASRREDELGALIDGFNHMLEQIAQRDESLAHYSQSLEDKVSKRTRELNAANEKRINWLESLAGFLRHELKNAIIGVRTSLELLERKSRDGAALRYAGRARKSMDYMSLLMENVGSASTLEAAIYREPKERTDLVALAGTRVLEYRAMYPETRFDFRAAGSAAVIGQPHRLIQMLDKLIANAVEHHQPNTPIRIDLCRLDKDACLRVMNEGVRLPDDRERIFELFISMRDLQRKQKDNLGLGLYVVKLVVDSHRGRVIASDHPTGVGAQFEVRLPLIESRSDP